VDIGGAQDDGAVGLVQREGDRRSEDATETKETADRDLGMWIGGGLPLGLEEEMGKRGRKGKIEDSRKRQKCCKKP
jgi:hypothetical protein